MNEQWSLIINKEYCKFSCAHFLIFPDGSKERLHGHNYHVSCEIDGALSEDGLVIDFILVKPVIRAICDDLDEHWIIPGTHKELTCVHGDDGHTDVVYRNCQYRAPTEEVIVLPINNTSVENLSCWFAQTLHARLCKKFSDVEIRRIQVAVSETRGQSAQYTMVP